MADYNLRLWTSVLNDDQAFVADLTRAAADWKRSIRDIGGYWMGSFSITGDAVALYDFFDNWLGYHLQEKVGSQISWEGMVYEMELSAGSFRRRRSLDDLYNAGNATYTTFDYVTEMLTGGDFETVTANDFDGWHEGAGVADETVNVNSGSHACKITSDGELEIVDNYSTHKNTWIRQNINTTAGTMYKLIVYGDGRYRIAIRNPSNPTGWILPPTTRGAGALEYKQWAFEFPGPIGGETLIYLYPGLVAGDAGYFDDASVLERGEVVYELGWYVIDGTGDMVAEGTLNPKPSLDRYGRREEWLSLDNYPQEASLAHLDKFLSEHNWPVMQAVAADQSQTATLTVTALGYVHTMNWMFVQEGDGEETNLNNWLSSIIGTDYGLSPAHGGTVEAAGDCQFVKRSTPWSSNATQVLRSSSIRQRAWDQIVELLEFGIPDSATDTPDYMPARCWVGPGRNAYYQKIDRTPRYFMRNGKLYNPAAGDVTVSPWLVQPGVWRDMDFPIRRKLARAFLAQANDSWIKEVEVDAQGRILPKPALFSETDLSAKMLDYYPKEIESPMPGGESWKYSP
uniref:Uncharacterized protein n=1 Tax=viral metagenome TaxID=1070528 RepID=A0A6M3KRA7_9ZZZZ